MKIEQLTAEQEAKLTDKADPSETSEPPIYYAETPDKNESKLLRDHFDRPHWRFWALGCTDSCHGVMRALLRDTGVYCWDYLGCCPDDFKARLVKVSPEELIRLHGELTGTKETPPDTKQFEPRRHTNAMAKLGRPVEDDKQPDQPETGFPPLYKPDWKPLFFHTRSKGEPAMRNNEVTRSARLIDWVVRRAAKLGIRCAWDVTKFALKMGILYAAIFHINWNAFLVLGSDIAEFVTTVIR